LEFNTTGLVEAYSFNNAHTPKSSTPMWVELQEDNFASTPTAILVRRIYNFWRVIFVKDFVQSVLT